MKTDTTDDRLGAVGEQSKTVTHAIELLEELRLGGPGTLTELARRTDLSRTATRRLLTTLSDHGFVRRTGARYDLGFAFLRFEAAVAPTLRRAARPVVDALAHDLGETVAVATRDGEDAVVLLQVTPPQAIVQVRYRPGLRHPLGRGAHGRCLMAVDATRDLAAAEPGLVAQLAETARVGYAVSHDELEPGVTGLAAPILTPDGSAMAALGVIAPSHRFPDIAPTAAAIVSAAAAVATTLAGDPPADPIPTVPALSPA